MSRLFFCYFLWFLPIFSLPMVEELTLEEKIGQLLLVHFRGETVEDSTKKVLSKASIGGIIYYPFANGLADPIQVSALSSALQAESRIPLFISIDQEGGRVSQFAAFPSQREQTHLPIKKLTLQMGKDLKRAGINVNFSPVVDVDSNPRNPIIGNRSFSADPNEVIRCAKESLAGYSEAGILCCLKHFPGHGDSEIDSHLGLPIINKSLEELEKVELAPFYALHDQVDLIMTGHLVVPALDEDYPATLSSKILINLLREQWGYKGVIISDSLIMRALSGYHQGLKEIALNAFNAGCDILCISGRIAKSGESYYEPSPEDYLEIHSFLVDSVKNGAISESRLNESVQRILDLKAKYRL